MGDTASAPNMSATTILVENHRAFLRYLEGRTGDHSLAEDILQDAFVRSLNKLDDLPEEAVVPWFYRTLRNAVIDHWRRRGSSRRAFERYARELEQHAEPDVELKAEICACISRLAESLKPEYAEVLRQVEIEGMPVTRFASSAGLSKSNAGVRVYRARQALKKRVVESCGTCAEHGCRDCTCQNRQPPAATP